MIRPYSLVFIFSIIIHFICTAQQPSKKPNIPSFNDLQNSWTFPNDTLNSELVFNQFESISRYPKKNFRGRANASIQLDSAISIATNEFFSYHENGVLQKRSLIYPQSIYTGQEYQYFDTLGKLVADTSIYIGGIQTSDTGTVDALATTYKFDSLNNLIEQKISYQLYGNWFNHYKYTRNYNSNNLLIDISIYEGNGSNWIEVRKYVLTYDSNDLLIERIEYYVDSNQLSIFRFIEYTYAGNGLSDTTTFYHYDSLQLILSGKQIKTYNNNANTLSSIFFIWNNNQWVPDVRYSNTYNNGNLETSAIFQVWNSTFWNNNHKLETSYDQFGNKNLIISYDGDSTSWINQQKREYVYDMYNNYQQEYWYLWGTNQWYKIYGWKCNVDTTISISHVNFPNSTWTPYTSWFYNKFENKLVKGFSLSQGNTWQGADSVTYYYSNIVTGITEVNQSSLLLYPNPTTNTFNISGFEEEFSTITIFDISGKQLKTFNVSSTNNQIDIGDLKPGIYLVQLNSKKRTITKRIVKL